MEQPSLPPFLPYKYRSKTEDSELYNQMCWAHKPFLKLERRQESLHPYNNKRNEALNQSVAKYAPK